MDEPMRLLSPFFFNLTPVFFFLFYMNTESGFDFVFLEGLAAGLFYCLRDTEEDFLG
jgi:hypothetical protein